MCDEPIKQKTTIERAFDKAKNKNDENKSIDNPVVDKMQRSPVVKK